MLAALGTGVIVWVAIAEPRLGEPQPSETPDVVISDPSSAYHTDGAADTHDERIPPAAGQPSRVIDVELTDFEIRPDPIAVEAATTLRLRLVNTGTVQHEFRLANGHDVEEHLITDGLNDGSITHPESESMVAVLLDPNETREIDVQFSDNPDIYTVAVCLIRGHYEAGMWANLEYISSE